MAVDFKELVRMMLQGWCNEKNAGKERHPDHFGGHHYLELVDNDQLAARLLVLFSHWDNDILCIAGEYGWTTSPTGEGDKWIVIEVGPPPESEGYYWSPGAYSWKSDLEDHEWVPGQWLRMGDD